MNGEDGFAEASSLKAMIEEIISYVDRNYQNPNLNVAAVAEHIGKNPCYLSRAFKSATNESLLDYINGIRIDHAVTLITQGNYSVEEISIKVGYASCKTFRRAFAKKLGITPGKLKLQMTLKA